MATGPSTPAQLLVDPIGIVRTAASSRDEAARQPGVAADRTAEIHLYPGRDFQHALEDLAGWEYIWVLFWFHLNRGWRPKVLPPRSTTGRKGVFATRAPHRPNPIGLSAVRLERIEGLTLFIRGTDMLDGTPVLDLKPYVPYTDAHPAARSGWLDAVADPLPAWDVTFTPVAAEQAAWIEARTGLALRERVAATLALGPQPHPYRRIRRLDTGLLLAVREWRVRFTVDGRCVSVSSIASGFRPAQLAGEGGDETLGVHRAFQATWPAASP
ncbi:tRNA (adenine(37)-N6)-methyltransferase [Gammaproteobacteria bacterium]|nr:tRNA (N6-threonylcarbamoyladenosine(37)-N6)-methyltransferase TrmO [Gammaproteobacteria bacterium]CAG0938519.1 tRNA (adenine(37)-N6)-methyltransferase [Gammaproteobacteria bacterium]